MGREPRRYALVLTTAETQEIAAGIARRLVERRLAACVNILPGARSIYRWRGSVSDEPEALLVVKTAEDLLPAVQRAVRELHTYELPEVLLLPIEGGDPAYLAWLEESLAPADEASG